jgi:hypothetical protein
VLILIGVITQLGSFGSLQHKANCAIYREMSGWSAIRTFRSNPGTLRVTSVLPVTHRPIAGNWALYTLNSDSAIWECFAANDPQADGASQSDYTR